MFFVYLRKSSQRKKSQYEESIQIRDCCGRGNFHGKEEKISNVEANDKYLKSSGANQPQTIRKNEFGVQGLE